MQGKSMEPLDKIKQQVEENPVILFMKGTPQAPQCGFSMRTAQALQSTGVPFAFVNVLADEDVYHNLPNYANWPTFPQLYIKGELIGGCDITLELHQRGDLETMVKQATEEKTA